MFDGFFAGKRVFVTGHTGFKGSWLSAWLLHLGATVCGYSDGIPSHPSLFEQSGLAKLVETHHDDVRNLESLKKAIRNTKPHFVFHLAAQALVRKSYDQPIDTFSTNAMGTANLLESLRSAGSDLQAAVIATSDKCYQNPEDGKPFIENDPMGGDDPYSASKGAAELIFHSYSKSFFANESAPAIVSVRAGNVIGGGDWALDRIVPDCVRAWEAKQKVVLRSPNSIRPWQHVLEPLAGYLLAAKVASQKKTISGESYNFGPGAQNERSVQEVVSSLAKHCEFASGWAASRPAGEMKEAVTLRLNPDKAQSVLGWRSRLSFDQTMEWTGHWYNLARQSPGRIWELTLGQIKTFEAL